MTIGENDIIMKLERDGLLLIRSGITYFEASPAGLFKIGFFMFYHDLFQSAGYMFVLFLGEVFMQFQNKINNNVALVKDTSDHEFIVVGKGVGFGKRKGDVIEEKDITRRFYPDESNSMESIWHRLENIKPEIISMATEISRMAEKNLNIRFCNHHYIILADHINFAIARIAEGIDYNDSNRWEVKKLYSREYQAAVRAIEMVTAKWKVRLPKSEEVFLTYHFVNAENSRNTIKETFKLTELMGETMQIIEKHFNVSLNEEEFNYIRMTNHLKYFFIRKMHNEGIESDDHTLADSVRSQCKNEHAAVVKICRMLKQKENWDISVDEMMFLTLHIWRVKVGLKNNI